jgi:transposase-like protein
MFIGGIKPGKRGRGAEGKSLVAVAGELLSPTGFGRCRLRFIPNAQAPPLRAFLLECVRPGSFIVTDGLSSYPAAIGDTYCHRPHVVAATSNPAHVSLPGVHRVASLLKRWLLGTHQGAVEADQLQAYLDEFPFRFNRRCSEFRGLLFRRLLEQAVQGEPMTYRSLVMHPSPKLVAPQPPGKHRTHPSTLSSTDPTRPWRDHNQ